MINFFGIIGGTFDPVHIGHIILIYLAQKLCKFKKIIVVPCYRSPSKIKSQASAHDRLTMLKLATKTSSKILIEPYEIESLNTSYTIHMVKFLRQKYPNVSLALIMGMDVFNNFHYWYRWKEIIYYNTLIIVNRINYQLSNNNILAKFLYNHRTMHIQELHHKESGLIYFMKDEIYIPNIDSTKIRSLINLGQPVDNYLHSEVYQYIKNHHLYNYNISFINRNNSPK